MTCRSLAVLSLLAAFVPAAGLVGIEPAAALAPSAVGYWVKDGVPVPTVPKGGLVVASDGTSAASPGSPVGSQLPAGLPSPTVPGVPPADVVGPAALSAVRITGVSAADPATLTLEVAPGSLVPPATLTTIVACPLTGRFPATATAGADISTAPGYDCSSDSPGRVAGDQGSISWLLPPSFQANPGELDVALVPNPAGDPVAFSVAFAAPGSSAVEAATGPPPVVPTATTLPATTSAPVAPTPTFAATPLAGFAEANPIPALAAPAPLAAPVAPAPRTGVSASPRGVTSGAHLPGDDRAHRLLAVLVLLALAVAWWYAGGQPARAPRLLGGLRSEPALDGPVPLPVGGIGRFARPRPLGPRRL